MFGFTKKKSEDRAATMVVARIDGRDQSHGHTLAEFFLVIGFIAMVIAVVAETSAIRLAAWGAIWTGWNVLCAIPILSSVRWIQYTVYRDSPPPPPTV